MMDLYCPYRRVGYFKMEISQRNYLRDKSLKKEINYLFEIKS